MPELPDITVYLDAIDAHITGHVLLRLRLASPFVLRTFDPPPAILEGRRLLALRRIGKRIVFDFGDELFLVLHLMIAGRLLWKDAGAKLTGKINIAALDFDNGTLVLTEAGSKRRASIHVIQGEDALGLLDPGGVDVRTIDAGEFGSMLRHENHTLKRSLTDPHLFSGIGNAYSDEILHRARLSPVKLTSRLTDEEIERLHRAASEVIDEWIELLRRESKGKFPVKVTAFRPEMAVHGKYAQPCPVCGTAVQRIVYADNETNYCPRCQTDGKLLADRALSRLLGSDWPKSIDDIE